MPDKELFDRAELMELLDGDEEFVQSIIELSLIEIPKNIDEIKEFCAVENYSSIRLMAHTIKGMAANLCTTALRDIAFKMETAAKVGDIEAVRKLLPELEQTARKTVEAILK